MQLTADELICFNSLLGGKEIDGVPVAFSGTKATTEEVIASVVDSLKKNELVDDENKLTVAGNLILGLLREYKKSEKIVYINHLRCALVDNNKAVIIKLLWNENEKVESVYITYADRNSLIYALLREYPELRNASKKYTIPKRYSLKKDIFYNELNKVEVNKIMTIVNKNISQCDERKGAYVYYWNESECHRYSLESEVCEDIEAGSIRHEIIRLLEAK